MCAAYCEAVSCEGCNFYCGFHSWFFFRIGDAWWWGSSVAELCVVWSEDRISIGYQIWHLIIAASAKEKRFQLHKIIPIHPSIHPFFFLVFLFLGLSQWDRCCCAVQHQISPTLPDAHRSRILPIALLSSKHAINFWPYSRKPAFFFHRCFHAFSDFLLRMVAVMQYIHTAKEEKFFHPSRFPLSCLVSSTGKKQKNTRFFPSEICKFPAWIFFHWMIVDLFLRVFFFCFFGGRLRFEEPGSGSGIGSYLAFWQFLLLLSDKINTRETCGYEYAMHMGRDGWGLFQKRYVVT